MKESMMAGRSLVPDAARWPGGDRLQWLTLSALVFLGGAAALRVVGVPSVDLHGPTHFLGLMDPFCGGTRATYLLLTGEVSESLRYNPGVLVLAVVALLALARGAVGVLTGRWLQIALRPGMGRVLRIVAVVAVLGLWVRQQINADLLTQPWPVP
ncbi:DUF2752 domain-containing protein [Nocardia farcinica]|uniref:DUF2752 domain-containing protein n=2 Tax=Nocardia farcinica TaxID=37329 RepID=UPI000A36EF8A|nr:DUF2752 domain-containing protein [Nocardia farcinica]MBF6234613.1 DUF2752 domain-containing protein [Nocardia farcinica]MBF6271033.1 DUF2752 domain-containing protein [Nocardia farcinica]MBF6359797.1 DUF2752 domain-containing protein [Nocardia farcinica]MBF6374274.1 DUF2752 domain-containing protein [Nocardia farcinica]MBF6387646.1 DUF2752 domain-containing protein [Nocardia farcinica]